MYGAVAGSAGLLGVAYQVWRDRARERDKVEITVAFSDQRKASAAPGDIDALEFGVAVSFVNHSRHPIYVQGGRIEQQQPHQADCSVFLHGVEVGPRRWHSGFFIPEWWIESEEIDLAQPIRGFVILEDGHEYASDWTVLRPARKSSST